MFKHKYIIIRLLSIFSVAILLFNSSCANRGQGPQGGPKDTTPPMLIASSPLPNSVNFKGDKVVLRFNEIVTVDNPFNNVIISPPPNQMPTIRSTSKDVTITFEDSLVANTTYTIDFTNSIQDYNEKNKLNDFQFSFATGDKIDSLKIEGTVINAETLAPMPNYTVGIYDAAETDSVFLKQKFMRIARTNSNGKFTINNIKKGQYKIYAINDVSKQYYYAHFGTEIAFSDSIITPEKHTHAKVDTLWQTPEKLQYDSIAVQPFYEYYPKDILLKTFSEKLELKQFLKEENRDTRQSINLIFNKEQSELPTIKLIENNSLIQNWAALAKPNLGKDTLTYFIKDTNILNKDTLNLSISYLTTDSAANNKLQTDTVRFVFIPEKTRGKKAQVDSIFDFSHNISKPLEIYDSLKLKFEEPILNINKDSILLYSVVDTLEYPVNYEIKYDNDSCPLVMTFVFDKKLDSQYQLRIKKSSIISWYNKENKEFNKPFSIKKLEDYSNLYVSVPEIPDNAILELLNSKELVIKTSTIQENEVAFEDIAPGKYYIRMYIDANQNGKWDTGNLLNHQQPELMYYMPKELNLRANWDVVEEWHYNKIDWFEQRPAQLPKPKK